MVVYSYKSAQAVSSLWEDGRRVLGSYDVITDANGNVVERLSFDAWGNRRNPMDWREKEAPGTPHLFTRGFTGHEHLDKYGVINMNGRLYDPTIGRFFSPDPYVQASTSTQGFNRYSYCLNNPLMYTDPDGEWFLSFFCPPLVVLDMALWSATIDLGIQLIGNHGNFSQVNWAQTGGAFVGGAIMGGFALAPALTTFSTFAPLAKYAANGGWAILAAGTSGLGGAFATDIFNGGGIGDDPEYWNKALKNIGISMATAGAISVISSAVQYATWDKYSPEQKLDQIRAKYPDAKLKYDPSLKNDFAELRDGIVYFGDKALANRAIAFNTMIHEDVHILDNIKGIFVPNGNNLTSEELNKAAEAITEINAYLKDIRLGPSNFLPIRYTKESIFNLRYTYGYKGSIPRFWRVPTTLLNLFY